MRKMLKSSLLSLAVCSIFATGAALAAPATVDVPVTATIQQASISLNKQNDVDFGTVVFTGAADIMIDAKTDAATPSVKNGKASAHQVWSVSPAP